VVPDEFAVPQIEVQEGDGHRQVETPGSRASRIEVQDAVAFRAGRLVRMAAHDNMKSGSQGINIERVNIVQDVDGRGRQLDGFGFGQALRPPLGVHISAHRKNRR